MATPSPNDLKAMRLAAGLTQLEMTKALGISQSQVSRYEENPEEAPIKIVKEWMKACGYGLSSAGIDPGNPYLQLHSNLRALAEYLLVRSSTFEGGEASVLDRLGSRILDLATPPFFADAGKFDAGKTRLFQNLIGLDENVLPAAYSPTTRLITVLMHKSFRPLWLSSETAFFGPGFDLKRIHDADYSGKLCLATGDLALVSKLVPYLPIVKKGSAPAEIPPAAYEAELCVMFLDKSALLAFTAIDFPGIGSGNLFDAEKAARAVEYVDTLAYLSPAAGFMGEQDLLFLPQISEPLLQSENGLDSLFLLATHARQTPGELEAIMDDGARRLSQVMGSTHSGQGPVSPERLRERCFAFLAEEPNMRSAVQAILRHHFAEDLPPVFERKVHAQISALKANVLSISSAEIETAQQALARVDTATQELEELERTAPAHDAYLEDETKHIVGVIAKLHNSCQDALLELADRYSEPGQIELILRRIYTDDGRKDAEASGLAIVLENVRSDMKSLLMRNGAEVESDIAKFQTDYQSDYLEDDTIMNGGPVPSFDSQDRFTLALSGVGLAVGAGAVIFMTFVTIPIAPFMAMGMAAVGLVGIVRRMVTDWQTALAQKIAQRVSAAGLTQSLLDTNRRYWRRIGERFEAGVETLKAERAQRAETLLKLTGSSSAEVRRHMERRLEHAIALHQLLEAAPWPSQVNKEPRT